MSKDEIAALAPLLRAYAAKVLAAFEAAGKSPDEARRLFNSMDHSAPLAFVLTHYRRLH